MAKYERAGAVAIACAVFAVGCSDSGDPADGDGAGGGTPSGSGSGPTGSGGSASGPGVGGGVGDSYTVTFDPITVSPGQENTQCVTKRVPNDVEIKVGKIHNQLPTGSHHLIVYRTSDTEEAPEPVNCQPFADTLDPAKGAPLMVTQKHDELLELPAGVGFTLKAGQMVRLEMHYINATPDDLQIGATSTFYEMAEGTFQHEADFLFLGNPDIDIPPNAPYTVGPTFLPLPEDLSGANFFGITGHTHQWGKDVKVNVATGEADTGTVVYDVPGWQWDEPATVIHDPPFQLPEGGGFRFTCQYQNGSNQQVGFGESANDEMCFFWAYYYPSVGSFVCAHTDQIGGGLDICCPGHFACGQLF
jgi:hypothetical protein